MQNAVSTTADTAISDATVIAETVVIGIAALRRMCRRITWRVGMPRLIAVCTCSRSASSRIAARVTRATIASEASASATAGSVKCRMSADEAACPSPARGTSRA